MNRSRGASYLGVARCLTKLGVLVSCLAGGPVPLHAGDNTGKITYADLVPGGMAIAGVTSIIEGPTSQHESRGEMAQIFETQFRTSRTDIPLMGADRVRSALGPDAYDSMLDSVQTTGGLSASELAALRSGFADSVRYVVVARLEREKIEHDNDQVDPDNDPKTENMEIIKTTTRKVEVSFQVYDLRDGTPAWMTKRSGEEGKSIRGPIDAPLFKSGTVAGMLESALGDPGGPEFPEPKPTMANLPRIFDYFARLLPQAKKKKK
jgi:hypothetical protein